jgi:UDP-N-acetylmuramoyl-tripeptide--D-alanyl-D-alanine ligase
VAGVSIDSRTVQAGELFIAIHGVRHDGHVFVAASLGRGGVAAVVSRARVVDYPEEIRRKLLVVDDTLAALQQLARAVREEWGRGPRSVGAERRLAAITGSTGKTTTKEILAALLATRLRVLKSEGNLNNEYGVPLTLLRLEEEHEAAAVELGMSHRGELERLAEIAQPEVGVVTCVAPVHLEFFSSVEEIAEAKRELIEHLGSGERKGEIGSSKLEVRKTKNEKQMPGAGTSSEFPVAVLNADDPRVMGFAEGFTGTVLTFGFGPEADFRAERIEDRGAEGIAFDFVGPGGGGEQETTERNNAEAQRTQRGTKKRVASAGQETRVRLELPLVGRHNVLNALAALAAASVWGIGAAEAKRVFPTLAPAAMRGEVLKFAAGFTVINDCYNSNPKALASMVGLLAATRGYRRRILAAGEMLELGPSGAELHREAGRTAATNGIDWIFGVQGLARELLDGAEEAGQPGPRMKFFETSEEAAKFLAEFVEAGDVLLVKGSRGVKMERIVEALTRKYALAAAGRN